MKSSNGTDHFGSVPPEYLEPPLKLHFARSYWLNRNTYFHLTKLLSQKPLLSPAYKYNIADIGGSLFESSTCDHE